MRRGVVLTTVFFSLGVGFAAAQAPAPDATGAMDAPTPAPSTAPRISRVDGAFSLPGGVWNCETLGNSKATNVYKLENATTISERTKLELPKHPEVELDTLYTFSSLHGVWTVSLQDGKYAGTAPPWSTDTWTFNGTYVEEGQKRPVRLVYTSLGIDALRIDYQAVSDGNWRTFSGATCKREIP